MFMVCMTYNNIKDLARVAATNAIKKKAKSHLGGFDGTPYYVVIGGTGGVENPYWLNWLNWLDKLLKAHREGASFTYVREGGGDNNTPEERTAANMPIRPIRTIATKSRSYELCQP